MNEKELKEFIGGEEDNPLPVVTKPKTILFVDTETTGLPIDGDKWDTDYKRYPHLVQIAWITGKEEEYIIKPKGYTIPDEVVKIHGIDQKKAEKEGKDLKLVLELFIAIAERSDIIVGHNLYFDTSIIKANCLKVGMDKDRVSKVLDKSKRQDTMYMAMKYLKVGKFAKLGEIYYKLFNKYIENQHTALADVRATKQIYEVLIGKG